MRYATIDIGTNSMRLLLAEVVDGEFVSREKIINTTRLGRGIDSSGVISEESIDENITALKKFVEIAEDFKVESIKCIGTAALRNAKNKDIFIDKVNNLIGIEIEIITGDQEALLGYSGVVKGLKSSELVNETLLIIDIGGGSTEFIMGDFDKIFYRKSVDVGALLLTEKFISKMPEDDRELKVQRNFIEENIKDVIEEIKKIGRDFNLIGIGGTITSTSAINQKLEKYSMDKIHNSVVSLDDIIGQFNFIKRKSLDERRLIAGLQPKRAEIILTGEMILISIMTMLEIDNIRISEFDNLEGLITRRRCPPPLNKV